ncbi:hypothetical protein SAMN04487983_106023 [Streptomyces sp. yr375]|uniref:hypothetical protein n=1 Tax=Streptomyces sp. yr375 TaxID=1761906 RepID=UPI0008C817A4|nr:hypothetical protein [Streptomyces sp. yr375]SES46471.1 hypothetical protein SAMN04487983_106023 [Streptomyces sp. yr375]
MKAVRRAVLLCVPALCALVSCGIPATGVVEAGGPAHGIAPTVRVYLVAGGTLVPVSRGIAGPVDVRSAVEALLLGPTDAERAKRLTTLVPPPSLAATMAPDSDPATEAPDSSAVRVDTRGDKVAIELPTVAGELTELAAAQVICTAADARRTVDSDTATTTLTVTVTNGVGHGVEGTDERCPDL